MEFKNNTKHRYKTIQGLRSFKNTLPKNVKKIISKKGHIYSETLDNWRYIVGEELFKVCFPKSFRNSNRFGQSYLSIMVKRGHEVDLEYSKGTILKKLNSYLGYNAVDLAKSIGSHMGGGGGGKADSAQAGGRESEKLSEAISIVPSLLNKG